MKRGTTFLCLLLSLIGIIKADADDASSKSNRLAFFGNYTIEVPQGWKRVEESNHYQIVSANDEVAFTATQFEAKKDGWRTFCTTRLKADFPSVKSTGWSGMVGHKDKDYRKHPFAMFMRYEGKVAGREIVYYTVAINCEDFFVSANFVGDQKSLPPGTDLPASLLKSIRLKE